MLLALLALIVHWALTHDTWLHLNGWMSVAMPDWCMAMGLASFLTPARRRDPAEGKAASESGDDPQRAPHLPSLVYERSHAPMIIIDSQGRIVSANPAFIQGTGFAEADLIGHDWQVQMSARHSPGFIDEMWSAMRQTGHWQGEVWNRRRNGETYPAWLCTSAIGDDGGPATHYVCVMLDIGAVKRSDSRWRHQAHHDPLTGLPNRLHFTNHLTRCVERARRHRQTFALMFVDLDHFKWINDTMGHHVGDHLLVEVGHRLQRVVRAEDFVARIGGDEFTILLEDMSSVDDAERMARKVLAAVGEAIDLHGQRVSVSASVGIAFFPNHGHDADELLRCADAAMYRAKKAGRRTFVCTTQPVTDLP